MIPLFWLELDARGYKMVTVVIDRLRMLVFDPGDQTRLAHLFLLPIGILEVSYEAL